MDGATVYDLAGISRKDPLMPTIVKCLLVPLSITALLNLTPSAHGASVLDNVCDPGEICLWANPNFTGRMLTFFPGDKANLTDWNYNDQMSSWRNRTNTNGTWWEQVHGTWFNPCHNLYANSSASSVSPDNSASAIEIAGGTC